MEEYIELNNFEYSLITSKNLIFFLPLLYNSRYFGLLLPYNNFYIKTIEKIENQNFKNNEIKNILLKDYNILKIIYKNDDFEQYKLLNSKLVYNTNKEGYINVYFDIRNLYDTEEFNRIYNIEKYKNFIIIKFNKDNINYQIKISKFKSYEENQDKWIKIYYNYDEYRRSPPYYRYVYSPIKFYGDRIEIIFNEDSNISGNSKFTINKLIKKRIESFINNNNISAGFPWYFQEWTRDTLISLYGIYKINKDIVKHKLIEYSNYFLMDGRLKNIKDSNVGNSDGIGLYIKRLFDFKDLFSNEEFNKIINIVEEKLISYENNYLDQKYFLFKAYPNESWMDTLNRQYPIEIQFLMMNSYDNLYNYTKKDEYKDKLDKLVKSVKYNYINDASLYDDIKNKKIRPNIFLSYYFYPKFLSNPEWERLFDYSLNHLLLYWGGLSSISKFDKEFIGNSNEDNYYKNEGKSMHNGDSWIFINNISALSLCKVNKEKYNSIINKILKSNLEFIYMIGTLPERASANNMKIAGALHQLWSLATYIELKDVVA
ncbi:glycogen debranching enzyme [Nanobdella aerobiophila]|uniref:Glycogen debranching enzyme n=1 Tax=Nanobdella aerobiophila TaxID=2586965 RepID=A0A915SHV3_9ARCH|nr:amylo-alpha-1,6-glucosidase [Nanobdella aerobiophila]BBL45257.1 glycogen debranching enzyme [Nanobdella aerobiophila]